MLAAAMTIDPAQLTTALRTIHPGTLSGGDAEAIVALAQLAVDADGQEDPDEIKLFFALGKSVFELAGLKDTPTPTFAVDEDDDERLRALAGQLATPQSRELAYAACHLLSIVDVQIQPAEDNFLLSLRDALQIPEERAEELAASVGEAITPKE
jgi:hypothetical protein